MENDIFIFDCEVFAHDWLFVFKEIATGEYTVIHNDNDAVVAFMERNPFLGGFNNKHYDNFILKGVMCGLTPEQIKEINDLIIVEEVNGWDIPVLREYRVYFDSFDLMDDCQVGLSLKAIEAHLGIPIEETEVDFNITHRLSEKELQETIYYCKYDVDATEKLYHLRQAYLKNKVTLGKARNLTDRQAMYMTNAKLTSVYLKAQKPEKPWNDERNYQYPEKLLRQYIPQEVFDFFDRMKDDRILSAGDYYLALGDNAHDALNNILAAKGASGMVDQDGNTVEGNAAKTYRWNYDTLDTESYRYSVTGEEVTNQFDDCNANYWQEGSVTYLTRQDWNGTFPTKAPAITCTEEMMQILQGELYTKPEDSPSVSDITQGQNNGLTFVSMKDVSFDDTETWDKYLDQMTVEELASQISDMFGTPEVSSVAKPAFSEGDGTASVGANTFPEEYGDTRDVCLYPCSVVAACMWNNDRLTRRGELMAEEALYCKLPLFWTGGGNLHRTPFGGRNGEYFSEDAVLTNLYTTTELTAVQSRGVTPGIKHVAGNDQEFHREGLAVFFNEQAFREQTLRAFEGALSNENTMALMQSFNRLGLVWSSSSKALCTQVLRKEWGFNGQQETDGVAGGAYKSHFATSLSAGTTTYCIDPTGSAASAIVEEIRSNDDGNMLLNLRDAVKRYHYMLSHTNLINGLSMNATVESIMPWWQIALYAIDVVFALLMVGSLFMMFRAKRRSEEKA